MAPKRRDIAVAGCGPAGLAAGLLLARQGHRVTLVDRFEAPQPLGSGLILQPTGLAVLDRLGLTSELAADGARIERLFGLNSASGAVVLDVRYAALRDGSFGLGIHRARLFGALFAAASAAGLGLETGFTVSDIVAAADGRSRLLASDGRMLGPFDLVVDALGSRSPLLRHAARPAVQRPLAYGALWANLPLGDHGFDPHALEQRYHRASVMVGVLPVGRAAPGEDRLASFFWSIKPALHAHWLARGLSAWKADVLAHWPQTEPLLAQIGDPAQLLLASYRHHTLTVPYGRGLVFIGDSAHATSPQLGQGANMALLDAFALSHAMEGGREIEAALCDYARLRRSHVRLYQAASRAFTPFYQSDGRVLPFLRDRLVPPLTRLPGIDRLLATLVAGQAGDPLGRLGLREAGMGGTGHGDMRVRQG